MVMASSFCPNAGRDYGFWNTDNSALVVRMRRNNVLDMTIVEQLVVIRENVCEYACKYREKAKKDEILWRVELKRYCRDCPLTKIHCK